MPQNQPSIQIPFRYVQDLPPRAQQQLFRNFEELARQGSSALAYDAVIDSALTASVPSQHRYKNLTDLLAGEAVKSETMYVGVIPRATAITDTANPNISGWGGAFVFAAVNAGQSGNAQWNWRPITVSGSQPVVFVGIDLLGTTASWGSQTGGGFQPTYYINCSVGNGLTTATTGNLFAWNTDLGNACASPKSNSSGTLWNCIANAVTISVSGVSSSGISSLEMHGCRITGTTTVNGTLVGDAQFSGALTVNTGASVVVHQLAGNGGAVTVAADTPAQIYGGQWASVTLSGGLGVTQYFTGTVNLTLDVTGPCYVDARVGGSLATFRGSGVRANIEVRDAGTGQPYINLVGCTDSLITAAVGPPGSSGAKAYAIDAASARSLLVLGGSHHANFTVASTNAGTNCTVIDENGAPPSGAAGGSLAGSYANPIFAGRDSSVDKLNQDMLPAALWDVMPSPVVYPPATGSSPTGGAGGSLAGIYPNPTFSGRMPSSDAIDKDIVAGVLWSGGLSHS